MSETNPLAQVDLAAVTAPRAPSGFAGSVLVRFATTEGAISATKRRRMRRIGWIAGSVASAAVVLGIVLVWPAHEHEHAASAYPALLPRHFDIRGIAVDLDRGAALAWTVEDNSLRVDQRGAATWRVPAGQHLHVEVAGVGAVDATNATLRVEAQMNVMDSKMIGATTATAALVTALTVTLMHGQATVTGAGVQLTATNGESAVVAAGKAPIELITGGQATAVEVVFSGESKWAALELETLESGLGFVRLPDDSTIGAVSYATGAAVRAAATPKSRFGAGWLGYVPLYRDAVGSDLVQGVTLGLAELSHAKALRKVLVIVGDGNDTNNSTAKPALIALQAAAQKAGITLRAVLAPGRAEAPSVVEQVGIPTIDASKMEMAHALAESMGGAVAPPKAVMVIYEGRGVWLTADVLHAIGEGVEGMDLPPDSRIGAAEFSTGASTRIPFEPKTKFKAAQLGTAQEYAAKRGTDLIDGVGAGLAQLSRAKELDRWLIVVGDGHDTNDESASVKVKDLLEQAKLSNVRIRAIQLGSVDTLPGSVLEHLDPQLSRPFGQGYRGRLEGVTMSLSLATE